MGSVFSSPSPPEPPPPPEPVEEVADTTEAEARRRQRLARGVSSTILAPVGEELPTLNTQTLFGTS